MKGFFVAVRRHYAEHAERSRPWHVGQWLASEHLRQAGHLQWAGAVPPEPDVQRLQGCRRGNCQVSRSPVISRRNSCQLWSSLNIVSCRKATFRFLSNAAAWECMILKVVTIVIWYFNPIEPNLTTAHAPHRTSSEPSCIYLGLLFYLWIFLASNFEIY